ncbi:TPA: hypothetical protein ACIDX1_000085 [Pseudomonas aeruginosa]
MPVTRSKIYLAGGFHSGWQENVKSRLKDFDLLDPGAHGIDDPVEYTRWDLAAVRESEIVLANMEASNPGGYALALEIGFAKALGKEIYLVDQIQDPSVKRYFEMVRQCSTKVFSSLDDAVDYILNIQRS